MKDTEQVVLRGRVLLTHQDTEMFFAVAWGHQHELVTGGISSLQAALEENKDGCFRSAVEWIHPEELGENVYLL